MRSITSRLKPSCNLIAFFTYVISTGERRFDRSQCPIRKSQTHGIRAKKVFNNQLFRYNIDVKSVHICLHNAQVSCFIASTIYPQVF